jgi:hypothetical protein
LVGRRPARLALLIFRNSFAGGGDRRTLAFIMDE